MGQRTKNRILEHTRPDHELKKTDVNHAGVVVVKTSQHLPWASFWICKCGWEGWLVDNLNDME